MVVCRLGACGTVQEDGGCEVVSACVVCIYVCTRACSPVERRSCEKVCSVVMARFLKNTLQSVTRAQQNGHLC